MTRTFVVARSPRSQAVADRVGNPGASRMPTIGLSLVAACMCSCGGSSSSSSQVVPSTPLSTSSAGEGFERGDLPCYRLVDLGQTTGSGAFAEHCPDSELAPDEIHYQADGAAPSGTPYILVSVDDRYEILAASGPLSQSGRWLLIESEAGGTVWFRFVRQDQQIVCSISMSISVNCELAD